MKNLKVNRRSILSVLAIALMLGITSCGKSKIRKNIAGTWNLMNITQNGVNPYTVQGSSISGTYVFSEMTKKENKNMMGTVMQDITVTGGGLTQTISEIASYSVLDKESILYGDSQWTVDLTDNALKLTTMDDPDFITELTFSK